MNFYKLLLYDTLGLSQTSHSKKTSAIPLDLPPTEHNMELAPLEQLQQLPHLLRTLSQQWICLRSWTACHNKALAAWFDLCHVLAANEKIFKFLFLCLVQRVKILSFLFPVLHYFEIQYVSYTTKFPSCISALVFKELFAARAIYPTRTNFCIRSTIK